jgi:hypothetical protein
MCPEKLHNDQSMVICLQANYLRLHLEPESAAAMAEVVRTHAAACRGAVGPAEVGGFSLCHPVRGMLCNLVQAAA